MKFKFIFSVLLFALSAPMFAQDSFSRLAVTPAGSDFNYEYFTAPSYFRVVSRYDTTLVGVGVARDTVTNEVSQARIEKMGSVLTIHNLANLSRPHYSVNVAFAGTMPDGSLVYRAGTAVVLIMNPTFGWCIVSFDNTTGGYSPAAVHYFGKAPGIEKYAK